jgi:hypothetical protein
MSFTRIDRSKGPMLGRMSLLLVALGACSTTPAHAQVPSPFPPLPLAQGTPEERAACGPDVQKFCCLQANRRKISAACNRVLVSHGQ